MLISKLVLIVAAVAAQRGSRAPGGFPDPPPPPYLEHMAEVARRSYFDIVEDEDSKISDVETRLASWAANNGVETAYKNFEAKVAALIAGEKARITLIIRNLAAIQSKLDAIVENKDQTGRQLHRSLVMLRESNPQEVEALQFIKHGLRRGPRGPGGPEGLGGPGGPPYLKNVTDQARRSYFDIVSNENLTISEIDDQVESWASTNGVEAEYKSFDAYMTSRCAEEKAAIKSLIKNLASIQSKIEEIFENKDQTRKSQRDARNDLRESNPVEVDALRAIRCGLRRDLGSPGGPGGPEDQRGFHEQPWQRGGFPSN